MLRQAVRRTVQTLLVRLLLQRLLQATREESGGGCHALGGGANAWTILRMHIEYS
jgi:hypothetical protein